MRGLPAGGGERERAGQHRRPSGKLCRRRRLLEACGYTPEDVRPGRSERSAQADGGTGSGALADKLGVGLPTLRDIAAELVKPAGIPGTSCRRPLLRTDVMGMEDLKPGMELKGTVRNVIDFGAFVDIGVHQDGLVHISQITSRFIKHPSEVLKVGDVVTVWVLSVDLAKKRIGLTMKRPPEAKQG